MPRPGSPPDRPSSAEFLTVLQAAGLALGGLRGPWQWSLLAVPAWAAAWRAGPAWRLTPAAGLWLAYLLWLALSAACSAEPLRGWTALAHKATALLFLLGAADWDGNARKLWLSLLAAAGVVLGLAALLVSVPSYPMSGLFFPYYNYTACVEAALLCACAAAALSPLGRRWGLLVPAAFALAMLAAARSRGALLASALVCAVMLWRTGRRRLVLYLGVAGLALAALLPVGVLSPWLKLELQGAYVRPQLWKAALAVAAERPFLGEGPGQFDRGFLRHDFPAPAGMLPTRYGLSNAHAHSEPLQVAAESGWPALVLYVLALGATLRRSWRGPPCPWREAALAAALAILAQSLVDNVFALPAIEWLFFTALGASAGTPPLPAVLSGIGRRASTAPIGSTVPWAHGSQGTQPPPGHAGPLQKTLCLAGLAAAALAWWPDWAARSWRTRAATAPPAESLAPVRAALRLHPGDPDLWDDLARAHLRREPPDVESALAAFARADELDPMDPLHGAMAAELLRAKGSWRAVLELSRRCLDLEPGFLQARLLAAEALLGSDRPAEAARELELFDRSPDSAPPGDTYARLILYKDLARREALRGRLDELSRE